MRINLGLGVALVATFAAAYRVFTLMYPLAGMCISVFVIACIYYKEFIIHGNSQQESEGCRGQGPVPSSRHPVDGDPSVGSDVCEGEAGHRD